MGTKTSLNESPTLSASKEIPRTSAQNENSTSKEIPKEATKPLPTESAAISSSREIPKPSQRAQLTSSRDFPRMEVAASGDGGPSTPKPTVRQPPSWETLISSSDKVSSPYTLTIQETTPREEVIYHEVVISPPKPAEVPSHSDAVKISHHKSASSSGLALPTTSSSGHSRSKSNTVSTSTPYSKSSPVSTSPPNISKMSSFQRVQQNLFLEEDLLNSGIPRKSVDSAPASKQV